MSCTRRLHTHDVYALAIHRRSLEGTSRGGGGGESGAARRGPILVSGGLDASLCLYPVPTFREQVGELDSLVSLPVARGSIYGRMFRFAHWFNDRFGSRIGSVRRLVGSADWLASPIDSVRRLIRFADWLGAARASLRCAVLATIRYFPPSVDKSDWSTRTPAVRFQWFRKTGVVDGIGVVGGETAGEDWAVVLGRDRSVFRQRAVGIGNGDGPVPASGRIPALPRRSSAPRAQGFKSEKNTGSSMIG